MAQCNFAVLNMSRTAKDVSTHSYVVCNFRYWGLSRLFLGGIILPRQLCSTRSGYKQTTLVSGFICFDYGIADSDFIPGSVTRQASRFIAGRPAVLSGHSRYIRLLVSFGTPNHPSSVLFILYALLCRLGSGGRLVGRFKHQGTTCTRKDSNNSD